MEKETDRKQLIRHVHDRLTEHMTAHAMRKTPERYAVLEAVYTLGGHFSIEQLDAFMADRYLRVSRATLFNTVHLLIDADLLVRHHFGNTVLYECTLGVKPHFHSVCTMCGTIKEMADSKLSAMVENMKLPRFRPSHFTLTVYGICGRCRAKQQRQRSKENKLSNRHTNE